MEALLSSHERQAIQQVVAEIKAEKEAEKKVEEQAKKQKEKERETAEIRLRRKEKNSEASKIGVFDPTMTCDVQHLKLYHTAWDFGQRLKQCVEQNQYGTATILKLCLIAFEALLFNGSINSRRLRQSMSMTS